MENSLNLTKFSMKGALNNKFLLKPKAWLNMHMKAKNFASLPTDKQGAEKHLQSMEPTNNQGWHKIL